jgi:hypothetical protein
VSRLDPSGPDQSDAVHQATDLTVRPGCWPVPHIAVPFRSDMAAVVDGAAAGCPAWPLPQCPHAPAAVAGSAVPGRAGSRCPAGHVRCPRLRTAGIRRLRRPGPLDQRRRAQRARRCRGAGTAAAGPPHSCRRRPRPPWTPRPAGGVRVVAGWTLRQCPLSAAVSGTGRGSGRLPGVRTVGCPPRTPPHACGVGGYRNRSPGRRPLDGCRHRRDARASWRPSRSPSWART